MALLPTLCAWLVVIAPASAVQVPVQDSTSEESEAEPDFPGTLQIATERQLLTPSRPAMTLLLRIGLVVVTALGSLALGFGKARAGEGPEGREWPKAEVRFRADRRTIGAEV